MDELRAAIQDEYGFQIVNYREAEGQTVLHTNQGVFYLQSSPAAYRYKSRLIEKVKRQLSEKSGLDVLPLVKTKKGQPYIVIGDELHCIYRGVREAVPMDKPYAIGQALAQFHQATGTLTGERLFLPYSSLGTWPSMWRKKLTRYASYRDELDVGKGEVTPFDEYLLTTYTYVHHLGDTAVQYLHDGGYQKLVKETSVKGKIAYQNFDNGYVLFDENQKRHLIGEWCWVMDMRSRDIGQWIKAEIRRNGWQPNNVIQFLDGYNRVSPLLPEEYGAIYGLLLYPGRFLKLVDMYKDLPQDERENLDADLWQTKLNEELTYMEDGLRDYPQTIRNHYGVAISRVDWLWRSTDEKTVRLHDSSGSA